MCGIAGYASFAPHGVSDRALIKTMCATIRHRGPDDEGTMVRGGVALGNRRLSIIDVEGGHQPISNENGDVHIVYNGELYNSPELRRELAAKGHRFKTRTDTEVLVHLYEEEGELFIRRLNGMFAFALYDQRRQHLMLGRDRFGVKPLFYTQIGETLYFASELKALKVVPGFSEDLDGEALAVYLGLFFIPDPWTIYKSTRRLRPGHYIIHSHKGSCAKEYYDLDFSRKQKIAAPEAESEVARLFSRSVERQLLSDVPVGVLLSGGVDSRSVLAVSSRRLGRMDSFTLAFPEDEYNEGHEARRWSGRLGSNHHDLLFTEDDLSRRLVSRQRHLDEPYGVWINVAYEAIAHFVRENGCKVVLSGDGGDELFCGYPTLNAAYFARYYRLLPAILRKTVVRGIVEMLPAGSGRLPFAFVAKSFVRADDDNPYRNFYGFKQVIRQDQWSRLLTEDGMALVRGTDPFACYRQYLPRIETWDLVDALSYLDLKVFLAGNIFFSMDNAYMAASVEARVPFMDNDLVEFTCSLPAHIRFRPLKLKTILRAALSKHIMGEAPSARRRNSRYVKKGWNIPADAWLRKGAVRDRIASILSEPNVAATGLLRPAAIQGFLAEQLSGRNNNERILQTLTSLVLFLNGYETHETE